jgi:hypothetical protein
MELSARAVSRNDVRIGSEAALSRNVKGVLFLDYVRMIRSHKGVDWATHLLPQDLKYLREKWPRSSAWATAS